MSLIALLRNNKCEVKYDQGFDPNWSDEQLLSHVIKLHCSYHPLTSLPDLPNCQELFCWRNRLITLPDLPNCQILLCSVNQLTTLPDLPNCRVLYCDRNQLTTLPDLPNCRILDSNRNRLTSLPDLSNCHILHCYLNQLTTLPDLPNCQELRCQHNQLPFEKLEEWKIIWKTRKIYLSSKYLRLWYRRMLQMKAQKKQNLHLELIWSPETKFYQQTKEYRHFLEHALVK